MLQCTLTDLHMTVIKLMKVHQANAVSFEALNQLRENNPISEHVKEKLSNSQSIKVEHMSEWMLHLFSNSRFMAVIFIRDLFSPLSVCLSFCHLFIHQCSQMFLLLIQVPDLRHSEHLCKHQYKFNPWRVFCVFCSKLLFLLLLIQRRFISDLI